MSEPQNGSHKCDPLPSPSNIVLTGAFRITLLTERMARVEWSETGQFEDRRSFAVVHRNLSKIAFEKTSMPDGICIATPSMRIVLPDASSRPQPEMISMQVLINGQWVDRRPDPDDTNNLGGTLRTLDGMNGLQKFNNAYARNPREAEEQSLGKGLLSRSGCVLFDDSGSIVYEQKPGVPFLWPTRRTDPNALDWYVLAHGHDYVGALKECALVFGRAPLIPYYALGYWYSRYYPYNEDEFKTLVQRFEQAGIPLDVLVIDMDWHKEGWTGYSWDDNLLHDWRSFLGWLKDRGLHVSLNLHPHDGVGNHEDAFPAFCAHLNLDHGQIERVPFDCVDPRWMEAYFKHLHHPYEEAGVDFWWMDWQQGEQTSIEGLDPLPWLNEVHWEDLKSRHPERRPLVFSRYGGLGSHRYPIGFSGDTVISWESLALQPHLTATAANVMFGYWSHDIGGHHFADLSPELFIRWLQFGVYSPILRTHGLIDKRIDEYPSPFRQIMESAIRRRYELAPYIYSEMAGLHREGISLVRPMYYAFPEQDEAYHTPDQYSFGGKMIIAPVLSPVSVSTGLAESKVWLPEGEWWDTTTATRLAGGRWHQRTYALHETPVFVRAGTIIPEQPAPLCLGNSSRNKLTLRVYPGADGDLALYEDDGVSQGYLAGQHAILRSALRQNPEGFTLTLDPIQGSYPQVVTRREVLVIFSFIPPATSVEINGGNTVRPSSYDGTSLSLEVNAGELDLTQTNILKVTVQEWPSGFPNAFPALQSRIRLLRAFFEKECRGLPLANDPVFVRLGQLGNLISRSPGRIFELLDEVGSLVASLPDSTKRARDLLAREVIRKETTSYQCRMFSAHLSLLELASNQIHATWKASGR